jgi:SAM-dependent methyltransferase
MRDDNPPQSVTSEAKKLIKAFEEGFAEYSSNWVSSSQFHEASGDYEWAVSQLPGKGLTLEIGTGAGRSTLALLNHGCTVVGLDHNHYCLEETHSLLQKAGYPTEVIYRFSWEAIPEGGVRPKYHPLTETPTLQPGGCLLIEGDTQQVDVGGTRHGLTDDEIVKILKPLGFELAVCWFPGTGMPLPANPAPGQVDISTYKVHMIRNSFEVAARILPPGGHLHVVDRVPPEGSAAQSRRIFAPYNMNFSLITSEERITCLDGYSGVTLHQSSEEKSANVKLVSLLYQKPNPKAD